MCGNDPLKAQINKTVEVMNIITWVKGIKSFYFSCLSYHYSNVAFDGAAENKFL